MEDQITRPSPTQLRVFLCPESMSALKAYAAEEGRFVKNIADEVIVEGVKALQRRRHRSPNRSQPA